MKIRERLESLAEPDFRQFAAKLMPNVEKSTILGVRIPHLRKIAAEIVRGDWREYLANAEDGSFEEIMLQGMVIGCAKAELLEILGYVEAFLPKIDNWSVCDSFCAGLKLPKKYPEEMWEFIIPYLKDERAYYVRFAVVMLLNYYTDEEHIEAGLHYLEEIHHQDYYVQMAVAWAISIYYIKLPQETMKFLQNNHLDKFTYNKALQKITESRKVTAEQKKLIRSIKR